MFKIKKQSSDQLQKKYVLHKVWTFGLLFALAFMWVLSFMSGPLGFVLVVVFSSLMVLPLIIAHIVLAEIVVAKMLVLSAYHKLKRGGKRGKKDRR